MISGHETGRYPPKEYFRLSSGRISQTRFHTKIALFNIRLKRGITIGVIDLKDDRRTEGGRVWCLGWRFELAADYSIILSLTPFPAGMNSI
jgi:hypothetical protein